MGCIEPFKTKDPLLMVHSALSFMTTEVFLTFTGPEARVLKTCGLNTDWHLLPSAGPDSWVKAACCLLKEGTWSGSLLPSSGWTGLQRGLVVQFGVSRVVLPDFHSVEGWVTQPCCLCPVASQQPPEFSYLYFSGTELEVQRDEVSSSRSPRRTVDKEGLRPWSPLPH